MSKKEIKSFVNRWPMTSRRLHIHMMDSSFGPQTYFELLCIQEIKSAETVEASKVGSTIKEWYPDGYRWLRHFQEGLATHAYEDYGELHELNLIFGPVFVAGEYADELDKEHNDALMDNFRAQLKSIFDDNDRKILESAFGIPIPTTPVEEVYDHLGFFVELKELVRDYRIDVLLGIPSEKVASIMYGAILPRINENKGETNE